jgi:hypothetical protein
MGRQGVVTFLARKESLLEVDSAFRLLVEYFHTIPNVATFGVSEAGHLYLNDERTEFFPKLPSMLCIIDTPGTPHVAVMHELIRTVVARFEGAAFVEIAHPFGPPPKDPAKVWRILLDDNGALRTMDESAHYGYSSIAEHEKEYLAISERFDEIYRFWKELTDAIARFHDRYCFGQFDLEARINEIMDVRAEH